MDNDNLHLTVHKNAPTAISQRSERQPPRLRVMQLLTVLAEARQAAVSPQTLELYSSELAHHQSEDIEAAVRKLMYRRREEGETAFPDLATLNEEICTFARVRRQAMARTEERRQQEAEDRRRMEHPEEYVTARDVWAEFMEKRGAVQSPAKAAGTEIKHLKATDLRALADAMEKREAASEERTG